MASPSRYNITKAIAKTFYKSLRLFHNEATSHQKGTPLAYLSEKSCRFDVFEGGSGGFSARRSTYTPSHFCN